MIDWRQSALDDLKRILEFNIKKYKDVTKAVDINATIRATANTLDQKSNLSTKGRTGMGEFERFVKIGRNKSEYFIVFDDDTKGNITILIIKHRLEQYP